ncbi:cAMP-dependent protein kinase catalytic subunit beta-like [Uranotaenia lowii]|uniref:cAMP-dependent protein kinase catalytic subunit beta-like n=1 Tax=Uranotaenia lowii TaxID=190385 RepID=UPI002479D0C6|nr:cAMP-dependent protein kinase catalytic subunit beta-like [Uranotaenia lowii]XP_055595205.1 cAMP-dependent protein kinase catalytic subunit beta-like [Uranotaenia lowii]
MTSSGLFSSGSDYKQILNRLKTEFEKRYNASKETTLSSLNNYDILKIIGTGAFGVVKLIRKKNSDQYYAMKILSKAQIVQHKQIQHTINEKRILQSVNFPFLVHLETCAKDNSFVYLVMPFINGGEMYSLLRSNKRFSEDQSKFYAAQIALALEYLHYLNLVYRDLKPENVLIDHKGYVKIADFGFCKMIRDRTWTLCGTPEYLAPELLQSKGYGKSIDWWTYGVVVYEMVAGYTPFYSVDQMKMFEKICKGKFRFPADFSADLRDLVKNILQVDLSRRFGNLKDGTSDIKGHPWFKGTNWIAMLNGEVTAPFLPKISGQGDTSRFDYYEERNLKVASKCQFVKEFADF